MSCSVYFFYFRLLTQESADLKLIRSASRSLKPASTPLTKTLNPCVSHCEGEYMNKETHGGRWADRRDMYEEQRSPSNDACNSCSGAVWMGKRPPARARVQNVHCGGARQKDYTRMKQYLRPQEMANNTAAVATRSADASHPPTLFSRRNKHAKRASACVFAPSSLTPSVCMLDSCMSAGVTHEGGTHVHATPHQPYHTSLDASGVKDSNLGSPSCCRKGFLERTPPLLPSPPSSSSISVSPVASVLSRSVVASMSTSEDGVGKALRAGLATPGGRVAPNAREGTAAVSSKIPK